MSQIYKIYREGNYIRVVDVLTNELFNGAVKDVFIDKSNVQKNEYTISKIKDFDETNTLSIGKILKSDDTAYSISEWETFYTKNTGNFNGGGAAPETLENKVNIYTVDGTGEKYYTADYINETTTQIEQDIQAQLVDSTIINGVTTSSSVPPTGNIHAIGVGAGTYPNWGGMVIPSNNIGTLSRVSGTYSVSLTAFSDVNKIRPWVSGTYASGDQVNYLGKDWVSNVATLSTDIPGISTKWNVRLTAYENKANLQVGKNKYNYLAGDTVIGFFLTIGGGTQANAFYSYTGYIPVTVGMAYFCNKFSYTDGAYYHWYDSNKVFISSSNILGVVAPAGAAFLRYSLNINTLHSTVQIEEGTVATTFEAYKKNIPVVNIPQITTSLLEVNSVTKEKIKDNAVSVEKAGFFQPQKNKFNINALDNEAGKYQDASGFIGTNASYYLSGYIGIKPSTWYYPNVKNRVTFFDENKVLISVTDGSRSTQQFQTPSNAAYLRMTWNQNPPVNGQLEEGIIGTIYEEYQIILLSNDNSPIKANDVTPNAAAKVFSLIPDNSLSRSKMDFFTVGKNKFNKNALDVSIGYYILKTNGVPQANASYNATGFVPVVAGLPYSFWTADGGNQYAWYDSNKVYISGTTAATYNNVIAPVGSCYIRFSVKVVNWENFQIEQGVIATSFVPYEIVLKTDALSVIPTPLYNNTVSMPSKIHLLKGVENSIYHQAITRRTILNEFFTRISGGTILNFENVSKINPANTSNISLVTSLYDGDFNNIKTVPTTAIIGDLATNPSAVSLLAIGDSFTDGGVYLSRLKTLLPNFSLFGTNKRTNVGGTANTVYSEGRSGWSLGQYLIMPWSASYAGFSPFLQPVSPYNYYGNTRSWKDWLTASTTEGFGPKGVEMNISASTGYRLTPNVNDVMYVDANNRYEVWNGSAWAVITAGTLGLTFNFTKYRSVWNITKPTFVSVMLGMNDFRFSSPTQVIIDFPAWKTNLDTIIASVFADGITKFAICLPLSSVGMMNNQGGNFVAMQNACLWEQRRLLIEAYDNREGEGIYIVDTGSSTDPIYGFQVVAESPFSEYTGIKTIDKTYNQPHPSIYGYNQMGTRLAAFIQALR